MSLSDLLRIMDHSSQQTSFNDMLDGKNLKSIIYFNVFLESSWTDLISRKYCVDDALKCSIIWKENKAIFYCFKLLLPLSFISLFIEVLQGYSAPHTAPHPYIQYIHFKLSITILERGYTHMRADCWCYNITLDGSDLIFVLKYNDEPEFKQKRIETWNIF